MYNFIKKVHKDSVRTIFPKYSGEFSGAFTETEGAPVSTKDEAHKQSNPCNPPHPQQHTHNLNLLFYLCF